MNAFIPNTISKMNVRGTARRAYRCNGLSAASIKWSFEPRPVVSHQSTPVLGIVGGIGSGKSAIAQWFAERHPVIVLDGDKCGHRLLQQPNVIQRISDEFGSDIVDDDGQVRRSVLASRVFGAESECETARHRLEAILHPQIREELQRRIEEARRDPRWAAILVDAAVLFEAGWDSLCDAVIFIDTPDDTRLTRVVEQRGWSPDDLRRREASQIPNREKRDRADAVVDNSGSLAHAGAQLESIVMGTRARS